MLAIDNGQRYKADKMSVFHRPVQTITFTVNLPLATTPVQLPNFHIPKNSVVELMPDPSNANAIVVSKVRPVTATTLVANGVPIGPSNATTITINCDNLAE